MVMVKMCQFNEREVSAKWPFPTESSVQERIRAHSRTEPKYAPRLLSQFNIHGATVTFDALSTTAQLAQAVLDRGGYYLLAVKDNQPKLFEAVRNLIENSRKKEDVVTEDSKHDREEKRLYTVVPASGLPAELLEKWPGLRDGCVVKALTRSFHRRNNVWSLTNETRWFITCHPYEGGSIAPWLAECIRGHWGVESFHWTMDMIWRQDWMQCQHPACLLEHARGLDKDGRQSCSGVPGHRSAGARAQGTSFPCSAYP